VFNNLAIPIHFYISKEKLKTKENFLKETNNKSLQQNVRRLHVFATLRQALPSAELKRYAHQEII
jgi:hypothetical protein